MSSDSATTNYHYQGQLKGPYFYSELGYDELIKLLPKETAEKIIDLALKQRDVHSVPLADEAQTDIFRNVAEYPEFEEQLDGSPELVEAKANLNKDSGHNYAEQYRALRSAKVVIMLYALHDELSE